MKIVIDTDQFGIKCGRCGYFLIIKELVLLDIDTEQPSFIVDGCPEGCVEISDAD